jgi:hypothetical protein
MKIVRVSLGIVAMAALSLNGPANAAVATQTLGDQDFTDGQAVGSGAFTAANSGDPSPFNTIIGSDILGPNFSASWTFDGYGTPAAAGIRSASVLIGLFEGDGSAAGNQVASFTLNGTTDLTGDLNTVVNAKGGLTGREDWYTVKLPASVFSQLASGNVTFALTLQNGLGVLGTTDFNGAGVDFSTLTVTTVPEPAMWSMLLVGAALGFTARKRAKPRPIYAPSER